MQEKSTAKARWRKPPEAKKKDFRFIIGFKDFCLLFKEYSLPLIYAIQLEKATSVLPEDIFSSIMMTKKQLKKEKIS